jgi:hypothetical protein
MRPGRLVLFFVLCADVLSLPHKGSIKPDQQQFFFSIGKEHDSLLHWLGREVES